MLKTNATKLSDLAGQHRIVRPNLASQLMMTYQARSSIQVFLSPGHMCKNHRAAFYDPSIFVTWAYVQEPQSSLLKRLLKRLRNANNSIHEEKVLDFLATDISKECQ